MLDTAQGRVASKIRVADLPILSLVTHAGEDALIEVLWESAPPPLDSVVFTD